MPKRIVVFRTGQLGDMLVSVPALWAIREHFADAHITLLCDFHPEKGYVHASDVLEGAGIVDDFICYRVAEQRGVRGQISEGLALLKVLRRHRYDLLVYLVHSERSLGQLRRDWLFFCLAGIRRVVGMEGGCPLPKPMPGGRLAWVEREGDLLLRRLEMAGIGGAGKERRYDINTGSKEEAEVREWLTGLSPDGERRWIAVAPGSKMPVKKWPVERYREVVSRLVQDHDLWPVVFGGREDVDLGMALVRYWDRGYVAAGHLGVRAAVAALSRCLFYLGNDTGTMHLAAAAGIKCVAIFTARDCPGRWYPYGRHFVFRRQVPCEGCMTQDSCPHGGKCINAVSIDNVHHACCRVMDMIMVRS